MIYRKMYCGYGQNICFLNHEKVITASKAIYHDMVFVYFESTEEALEIQDVVSGDMRPFPDGSIWFRMTKVFQYFTPLSEEEYVRKIPNKEPMFRINFLKEDMEVSYIYYHRKLQDSNPYNVDKFMSIFLYGNLAIIYHEEPREVIRWSEIEGREHVPIPENWDTLMQTHFKEWKDGEAGWVYLGGVEYV